MSKSERRLIRVASFLVVAAFLYLGYLGLSRIWAEFRALDERVALGFLTAFTTVVVSTLTVVLGRHYERKKDIDAHYRAKKTEIYDDFLREFFALFEGTGTGGKSKDLVPFLREWQRKMLLWGGEDVLKAYINWVLKLRTGEPDAEGIYMTEDFFRTLRKDLGHSSRKLPGGSFIHLILRHSELFIEATRRNPNLKLSEFAETERKLTRQQMNASPSRQRTVEDHR